MKKSTIRKILRFLPDSIYIRLQYYSNLHRFPDLKNPKNFNEKIQWLKLHDRNPEYITLVDKIAVKEYVGRIIGFDYIIPNLGVWSSPEEIEIDQLPNQFVLKCNHSSGGIEFCRSKAEFDFEGAKERLSRKLKTNLFWYGREWPYKNVIPKILAEPLLSDETGYQLKDYKIFNFDGEPKIIEVDMDRFSNHKRNLYDINWNLLDAEIKYSSEKKIIIQKPAKLDEMLQMARLLSQGFRFLRTDFYVIKDKILFGELTFYHDSGYSEFRPASFGEEVGSWIDLSK